jgi:hypothetical protein
MVIHSMRPLLGLVIKMLTLRDKLSIKFWCNLDLIVIVLLGIMLSAYSIGVVTLSKQRDQAIARQVLSCPEDCVIDLVLKIAL